MLGYQQDKNMSGELRASEETSDSRARNLLSNPFKGLDSYSEADADFFFARDKDICDIFDSLQNERLTILHGQSGVGKSSVLRAGVIPIFNNQEQENEQQLLLAKTPKSLVFIFPPLDYSHPWKGNPTTELLNQIEKRLKLLEPYLLPELKDKEEIERSQFSLPRTLLRWTQRLGDGERSGEIFIILDQFEEYFLEEHAQDNNLISALTKIIGNPSLPVNLLLAIRSDSLNQIYRHFKGLRLSNR